MIMPLEYHHTAAFRKENQYDDRTDHERIQSNK